MPRIDHDDDFDDDDTPEGPDGYRRWLTPWRRRALVWTLAAIGLGLGFLVPYTLYLNKQVGARFGQLQWQLPTRVYARPLRLAEGVVMDAATLRTELDAAGYRDDGQGERPGTYARNGGRWSIASRGFQDVDGAVAPLRIEATLSGTRVVSLRDAVKRGSLRSARLDAARIATLYGKTQEERRLVRIEEVPELLVVGLQAVEDRDFAHHHGIDVSGMLRAAFVNVRAGEARQGASTLTQQLARSGLLGIGREQTLTRKFNEILYALLIEARYDKKTILEAYFNQVYLGQRGAQAIHGVSAASEFWFGRELQDLDTSQIALLIGMIRGPSYYDPRREPEHALERRGFVLQQMLKSELIDAAQFKSASAAPLGVTRTPGSTAANRFPAYVDLVRRQLARDYPADALQGAGLGVMTAMSPSAQAYAEGAVEKTLAALTTKRRPTLQAGVVVTDVDNGQVLAVVGSRQFTQHGFNRAIEAQRPVGSLLKSFVYLLALAQPGRYSLASFVDDSPVTVTLDNGKRWNPGNSDGRSHGSVRMIDALAQSMNQATVRVGMAVDPKRLADLVKTLAGIEADANPSLILGAVDQSPYAMAQLYQFLASGGEIQPLHAVRGVLDPQGKVVQRYDNAPAPAQEGDAIAARLVTTALQYAVTNGTGRQLVGDGLGRLAAAGKTGTSNDSRDSWFAGWTGTHLAVAWVGNDANLPTGLYGATGAMRVWSGIFSRLPSAPLSVGEKGLDRQWIVQDNATDPACPGARQIAFVAGFAPAYAPCVYAEPAPVDGGSVDADGNPVDAAGNPRPSAWRRFFGLGAPASRDAPAATAPTPQAAVPSAASQAPATPQPAPAPPTGR